MFTQIRIVNYDVPSQIQVEMRVPVLLITFNRPDYTRRVLETIIKANPKDLYVFQDGVREGDPDDIQKCSEVKHVVHDLIASTGISLHTNYSARNLGCGPGPMTALNWFFSENDMGIILEDDAVPHSDFFFYCEQLLQKYKDDESVRAIGSMKIKQEGIFGDGSYYFSMMNRNLCAWATWERAWQSFDISLKNITRLDLNRALKFYGCGILERSYWCDRIDEVHDNLCDGKSWDMQFFMSIWLNHGKGIIPNVNLSSNIGTVGEATHVMGAGNVIDNLPTSPILPLKHPSSTAIQHDADKAFHFLYFEPYKKHWGRFRIAYYCFNKSLKRILGVKGPWIKRKN